MRPGSEHACFNASRRPTMPERVLTSFPAESRRGMTSQSERAGRRRMRLDQPLFFWEVVRNKPVTVRMDGDGLTPILETSCPKQRAMFANVRHVREPSAAPEEVNFAIATLRRARCVVPIDT